MDPLNPDVAWDWPLIEAVSERVRRDPPDATAPLDACIDRHLLSVAPLIADGERQRTRARLVAHLTGLGPLDELLADHRVTEVIVNSGGHLWVERHGALEAVGRLPADRVDPLVERIIAPLGLRFDRTSPIVDARLADGSRVCAVRPPLAVDGTLLSIRRFAAIRPGLDAFAPPPVAAVVRSLIAARANIVVSGSTSAGKTTLLGTLAGLVAAGERIITIEDTAELQLDAPHVVRLESRPATPDGVEAVDIGRLVRTALRLRPDRIVIGEVRGDEAWDMVQALNTGHSGCLTTVHANSPADAIRRITALAANAVPGTSHHFVSEQVRSSIDAVIHVGRGIDGNRHIVDIATVGAPDADGPLMSSLLEDGGR